MKIITITELRKHLGYYLVLSNNEEVFITKHNKIISCLVGPTLNAINYVEYLNIPSNLKSNKKLLEEAILSKNNLIN